MSDQKQRPLIGISSCLLGNKVRYDGGDKYHHEIVKLLSQEFEMVSFCPEMAIGLGVPRQKIQLVNIQGNIRCVDQQTRQIDYTSQLAQCCDQQSTWLKQISGYIFKTKSPSCGLSKVKIMTGQQTKSNGRGIFAAKLLTLYPELPVIEEDEFDNLENRNRFLNAVKNYSTSTE